MFCPKCGAELPDGSRFCGSCGAQLAPAVPDGATGQQPPVGQGQTAAGTAPAAPGTVDVAAGAAKSRKTGLTVGGIAVAVVAVLAVAAFALVNALGLFGGGSAEVNQTFNNAMLSYNAVSSGDGWDYFYSDTTYAIMRGKTDGTVETVVSMPTESMDDGSGYTTRYVSSIMVDGSTLYYLSYPVMFDDAAAYEIHKVDVNTGDDETIYTLGVEEDEDGTSYTISRMFLYDHQLYLLVNVHSDWDPSMQLVVLDSSGEEVRREDKYRESGNDGLPTAGVTPTRDVYATSVYDDGSSMGRLYVSGDFDGNFATNKVYEVDDGWVGGFALVGDRVAFTVNGSTRDTNAIMIANEDGSDLQTLYTAPSGATCALVAATDDTLFIRQYVTNTYDVVNWDLIAVPAAGGEAETIASNLDYYNASLAVVNGHLLIMENGQDISSQGMRVAAYSFEGDLLATYVSGRI